MQKTPDKLEEKTSANEETEKNHNENTNVEDEDTQEIEKEITEKETTPVKQENAIVENEETSKKQEEKPNTIETITPKKQSTPKDEKNKIIQNNGLTPLKELKEIESKFKTPEKTAQHNQSFENKTPEKDTRNDLKLDSIISCDGEDGMISTTEQARLLIAASRTPSKLTNKTPVKHSTPNGKRSLENSPVTPGKHRRVELITLASPKAKRIKQI